MLKVSAMASDSSVLWIGTEGGLLSLNPETGSFTEWTNTEGLSSNTITALMCDAGVLWIGFSNGLIQYTGRDGTWSSVSDYAGYSIRAMHLRGDSLFIGLDIGVSLYRISRQEVKETYRHLGWALEVEVPVNDILLNGQEIWVATDEGIAHSSLAFVNLLDPESWSNVTVSDGLPGSRVNCLAEQNGKIYAGTESGSSVWDGVQWTALDAEETTDLAVDSHGVVMANPTGVYVLENSDWKRLGSRILNATALLPAFGTLWCGTTNGFYEYRTDHWVSHSPDCAGSNVVSDIAAEGEAGLWISSRDNGISHFDGFHWRIFNKDSLSIESNDFVAAAVDLSGHAWMGSWGGGIVMVGNGDSLRYFNAGDGSLAGITGDPAYTVVVDVTVSPNNTVWILNREAWNGKSLVAVTRDQQWAYFGSLEGLPTTFVTRVEVDDEGRIWVGTDAQGVYIFNDAGTPTIRDDDAQVVHLTTSDGLLSNTISALAADGQGGMWIGTSKGLNYEYRESVETRYGLPSDNIACMDVDGAGNLWVGTDAGVGYFSPATYQWTHFSTENSPLVSDDISSLCINVQTGIVYAGTSAGISAITTPFSRPDSSLQDITVYPNPFKPKDGNSLTIDHLAQNVSISIFTSTGRLIRHFSDDETFGRRMVWDGSTAQGDPCPSGIYIVLVQSIGGEHRTAKVALIR